jgi:hypothetical protein
MSGPGIIVAAFRQNAAILNEEFQRRSAETLLRPAP